MFATRLLSSYLLTEKRNPVDINRKFVVYWAPFWAASEHLDGIHFRFRRREISCCKGKKLKTVFLWARCVKEKRSERQGVWEPCVDHLREKRQLFVIEYLKKILCSEAPILGLSRWKYTMTTVRLKSLPKVTVLYCIKVIELVNVPITGGEACCKRPFTVCHIKSLHKAQNRDKIIGKILW